MLNFFDLLEFLKNLKIIWWLMKLQHCRRGGFRRFICIHWRHSVQSGNIVWFYLSNNSESKQFTVRMACLWNEASRNIYSRYIAQCLQMSVRICIFCIFVNQHHEPIAHFRKLVFHFSLFFKSHGQKSKSFLHIPNMCYSQSKAAWKYFATF